MEKVSCLISPLCNIIEWENAELEVESIKHSHYLFFNVCNRMVRYKESVVFRSTMGRYFVISCSSHQYLKGFISHQAALKLLVFKVMPSLIPL